MKRRLLAVVALCAVGVGAAYVAVGGLGPAEGTQVQYLTSTATIGDVTEDIAATGTLEPQARYGLIFGEQPFLVTDDGAAPTTSTSVPVASVEVEVGDTVATGDILATADTEELERDLTAARNDLASARVSLRSAEDALEDAEDDDVTGQIRQAKISVYSARNQVAEAERRVDDLRAQIDAASLVAPIDGTVTEVNLTAGFDAPAGPAVVVDSRDLQVTTDVVEGDLADVRVGQGASVTVDAIDASLEGTVASIAPSATADSASGAVTYAVVVTVSDPPASARGGMSADVTITIASASEVLTVPTEALRGREGAYSVQVLDADGQPVSQAVEVGLVTNTSVEITSGLEAGTTVVTGTLSDLAETIASDGFPGGGFAGGGAFQGGGNVPAGGVPGGAFPIPGGN